MNRVILEDHLELITFTAEGRLLHTHKSTFVQRHSLETWITKAQRRPLRLTLIISGGENRSSRRLNLCWRCAMFATTRPVHGAQAPMSASCRFQFIVTQAERVVSDGITPFYFDHPCGRLEHVA